MTSRIKVSPSHLPPGGSPLRTPFGDVVSGNIPLVAPPGRWPANPEMPEAVLIRPLPLPRPSASTTNGAAASTPEPPPWDETGYPDATVGPTRLGRAFDIVIASLAILALLPLILLTALAIRASSNGPVLFVQQRVGHGGRPFPCFKFRSMVRNAQDVLERLLVESEEARNEWAMDQKLRRDPRITPVGRFLRKSSLDELPQLFNVLAGHMSIVGPRPIIASEIPRYGHRFDAYCSVKPGLTGLWQVSGRNAVSYEARVRLDARYAMRKSLTYDLTICLRTVPAVLASRGCY